MMPMMVVSQETVVKLGRCCRWEVSWTTEERVEMPSIYTPHRQGELWLGRQQKVKVGGGRIRTGNGGTWLKMKNTKLSEITSRHG